jgi:acetyltransferase
VDEVLAEDLIDRTRISRLLAAYRDVPAVNRGAIVRTLLGLSQLIVDYPSVVGVDINPLLASAEGVIALDARIEINPDAAAAPGPNPRLVVRPYPAELATTLLVEGRSFPVRPIRPTDAALYPAFLSRVSEEDMRWRFLAPLKALSSDTLVRLTQLDYERDLAFVALEGEAGDLAGIARYASDPDHEVAEFGVLIRSDLQGHGLGMAMMKHLIATARSEGLRALEGSVLADNARMRTMCRELGFVAEPNPSEPRLLNVRLALN